MKYSSQQAEKIASQIRERFGLKIAQAVEGTPVPAKFVAGLIAVEAGKDKKGQISETAMRFERGVFARLQQVRDGKRSEWSGIKTKDVHDASDLSLKALATSYGLTQVMGWHCIHNLNCTVAGLRDPDRHLGHAVKLLMLNSADGDFERQEYVGEFREWNSGSEKGKTYDVDYVHNAGLVMDAYAAFPESAKLDTQTGVEPPVAVVPVVEDKPKEPTVTTVPSHPPVVEVKSTGVSWTTKISATLAPIGTFFGAVGLKIGGVQITNGVIITFLIVFAISFAVGAWIYNEGKKREQEKLKWSMDNLANAEKGNVIAKGST